MSLADSDSVYQLCCATTRLLCGVRRPCGGELAPGVAVPRAPVEMEHPFHPLASGRNQIIVSHSNHLRLQNHVIPGAALMAPQ